MTLARHAYRTFDFRSRVERCKVKRIFAIRLICLVAVVPLSCARDPHSLPSQSSTPRYGGEFDRDFLDDTDPSQNRGGDAGALCSEIATSGTDSSFVWSFAQLSRCRLESCRPGSPIGMEPNQQSRVGEHMSREYWEPPGPQPGLSSRKYSSGVCGCTTGRDWQNQNLVSNARSIWS